MLTAILMLLAGVGVFIAGMNMLSQALENEVDGLKRTLSSKHYARLAEGKCRVELSPYFTSTVSGLERVADHLVNVGYSILNPTGSQSEAQQEAAKA